MYLKRRYFTQPPHPRSPAYGTCGQAGRTDRSRLRLYRPLGPPDTAVLPVLVYYHGGGHVLGDLEITIRCAGDALASRSCS